MKKLVMYQMIIAMLLWGSVSYGMVQLELLAPTELLRGTGAPITETITFSSEFGGPSKILIINGDLSDSDVEMVSSSVIGLNGQSLAGPSDFNQKVSYFEKEVVLIEGNNILEVELRGKTGGRI